MCDDLDTLAQEIDRKITPCDLESMTSVVESYHGDDWMSLCIKDTCAYKKIKVMTGSISHDFEMFVITWQPGQKTPIHDHAEFGCILKVLKGELTETLYTEALTLKTQRTLSCGSVGFMKNTMGVHQVQNNSNETAVSLHVYSPANYSAKIF